MSSTNSFAWVKIIQCRLFLVGSQTILVVVGLEKFHPKEFSGKEEGKKREINYKRDLERQFLPKEGNKASLRQ